jgi:hypothetical protein
LCRHLTIFWHLKKKCKQYNESIIHILIRFFEIIWRKKKHLEKFWRIRFW